MATSSGSFCSLCNEDNVDTPAVCWCTDCSTFLCNTCEKHHSRNKASKNHSTIPVQLYYELPDFVKNIQNHCTQHNERFDVYCNLHECACCIECVTSEHKKCSNLRKLSEVLTNVKSSASFSHVEESLKSILLNNDKILQHLKEQKTIIFGQKGFLINEISKMQTPKSSHTDKLKSELIHQVQQKTGNLCDTFDKFAKEVESRRLGVKSMIRDLNIIKSHATNLQTFIAIDIFNKKIKVETEFLRSVQSRQEMREVNVVLKPPRPTSIQNVGSLGDIVITYIKEPLKLEITETAQAVVPMPKPARPTRGEIDFRSPLLKFASGAANFIDRLYKMD